MLYLDMLSDEELETQYRSAAALVRRHLTAADAGFLRSERGQLRAALEESGNLAWEMRGRGLLPERRSHGAA